MREQIELLEHKSEVQPFFPKVVVFFVFVACAVEKSFAVNDDLSVVGGLQKVQAPKKRRLSAARGADNYHDFAFVHFKIYAFQHFLRAERFFQIFNFENCHFLYLIIVQLLFDVAEKKSEQSAEYEIKYARIEKRPQHDVIVDDLLAEFDEFHNADDARK